MILVFITSSFYFNLKLTKEILFNNISETSSLFISLLKENQKT